MCRHSIVVAMLLSIAVAMLLTDLSLAQTTLPPVVITAPPGGSPGGSLDLEQTSAVSSRLGLKLREQPAAVEIVPGEVIRGHGYGDRLYLPVVC